MMNRRKMTKVCLNNHARDHSTEVDGQDEQDVEDDWDPALEQVLYQASSDLIVTELSPEQQPPDSPKVLSEVDSSDWSNVPPPSDEDLRCLKRFFGPGEFKPLQWAIIRSVLYDRRDNLCVVATGLSLLVRPQLTLLGYGKSLCYQFPAVATDGVVLVVSPLISLMEDQVLNLRQAGIKAVVLGDGPDRCTIREAIRFDWMVCNPAFNFHSTQAKIVYLTPEYIDLASQTLAEFRGLVKRLLLS